MFASLTLYSPLLVWKNKIWFNRFENIKKRQICCNGLTRSALNEGASASFRFAYDVESARGKFSKWRWNVSHARSCTCHRVLLGHIGTVGLSRYISLVFPKIFMARGRYLKYFQRFKRKIPISATHWNDGIKCLKVKANLWLLHPIHFNNGTLCSKCLLVYFALQNWRLWCP